METKTEEPIWIEEHLNVHGETIKGYWIGKKKSKIVRTRHNHQQKMIKDLDLGDKPICIIEVNENIRRVRLGEPLTRPLIDLRKNCDFVNKYNEMDKIFNRIERPERNMGGRPRISPEEKKRRHKERLREYVKRPEVREKLRAMWRTPNYKAKQREYYRLKHDERLAKIKEYRLLHKEELSEKARIRYQRKKTLKLIAEVLS